MTESRIVNVIRESEWRRQRLKFRSFWGGVEPTWITMDQLYETLAHGKEGEYVLEGA